MMLWSLKFMLVNNDVNSQNAHALKSTKKNSLVFFQVYLENTDFSVIGNVIALVGM